MSKKEFSERMESRIDLLNELLEVYKSIREPSDEDEVKNEEPKESKKQFLERWKKEEFIKEYDDFVKWGWGGFDANDVGSIEKLILSFSKHHPDLPLLRYVDEKGFNKIENIMIILLQAHKHYLNRKA